MADQEERDEAISCEQTVRVAWPAECLLDQPAASIQPGTATIIDPAKQNDTGPVRCWGLSREIRFRARRVTSGMPLPPKLRPSLAGRRWVATL